MNGHEAFAKELCDSMSRVCKHGMEIGMETQRRKLAQLVAAYDKALQDPNFKAPTYLHLAIEALR